MGDWCISLLLIIKALRKYLKSSDIREEKGNLKRTLGETIKEHRTKCNMTQEFVAESIGVSRQAVSKWESGISDPSTSNLFALAKLFEVSAAELLRENHIKKQAILPDQSNYDKIVKSSSYAKRHVISTREQNCMKKFIFGCILMVSGILGGTGWVLARAIMASSLGWDNLSHLLPFSLGNWWLERLFIFGFYAIAGAVIVIKSLKEDKPDSDSK